jgi:polysaccharide export outer membrane protein
MKIRPLILVAIWCVAVVGSAQTAPDLEYRVGPGDVLEVEAFDEREISGEFLVEPNGNITFPLLGLVPVAGKTAAEVVATIEQLLERDFYVDVQLKVEVSVFASQPVTVLGEVEEPGTYYLQRRTSLTEILARAGGLKSSAGAALELRRTARDDPGGTEGPPEPLVLSTAQLVTGEVGREIYLHPGDVIFVSPKKLFFITGEVARPGQYEISAGLTLMQAISQAGGVGKFASQSIEVHRFVGGQRKMLDFDLSQIRKGKVVDPEILASDVVYVKRRFF